MTSQNVVVVGGSGFLGRHIVRLLARAGMRVRVASRDPERGGWLRPMGEVGQVVPVQVNVRYPASIRAAVAGADAVVNLVGILYRSGAQRFEAVHSVGAGSVAEAAAEAGIERLVHVSAIGASETSSAEYARSKAGGEAAVRAAFPNATIVRPSVLFGPEDKFFNLFASLARFTPVLPLIGGGQTRFQPVYVGDVGEAVGRCILQGDGAGETYELGGPRVMTFQEVLEYILEAIGRRRLLVPVPFAIVSLEAALLQLWPRPLLTRDQVELLKTDNVASPDCPGLEALGLAATPIEAITPSYLFRYRKGGRAVASRFG